MQHSYSLRRIIPIARLGVLLPIVALMLVACGHGDGVNSRGVTGVETLTGEIVIEGADEWAHVLPLRVVVRLEDITLQGAASVVIAEEVHENVTAWPLSYRLTWTRDPDTAGQDLTVAAGGYDEDGVQIFWTDTVFPVEPGDTRLDFHMVGDQPLSGGAGEMSATFTGVITEVESGKDGGTVRLAVDETTTIWATVSIPNLGPDTAFDFSALAIGNSITVTGEAYEMDGKTRLTARSAAVVETVATGGGNLAETTRTLTGEIVIEDADELTYIPPSRVVVLLEDITLQDAASVVIAEEVHENVTTWPLSYRLTWTRADAAGQDLAVVARGYDEDGEQIFWTDTVFPVEPGDTSIDFGVVTAR